MEKIVINGGRQLYGKLEVSSAKNACLPILAAVILCEGEVKLNKVPKFEDIDVMCEILKSLNIAVHKNKDKSITFDANNFDGYVLQEEHIQKIRSSIFCLGPLLARGKRAVVSEPGGCSIGNRPIDLHLNGLRALNAKIIEHENGLIVCDGKKMKSGNVHLRFPSVGATENLMMAAVLLKGTTKIFNAAKEPEISDLANFLNKMGAKISGAGTSLIEIKGVSKLSSVEYTPIPDRIITGTLMIAPIITGGKIWLENTQSTHLEVLIEKLRQTSCKIEVIGGNIIVEANKRPKTFKSIETMPYPLFPTDLQPQMMALATISKGKSIVKESVFTSRFKHIAQLTKMGANISLKDNVAKIKGVKNLVGAAVMAEDLRGGACLVMAGLGAKDQTIVENPYHIDRGYENIEDMFLTLGADIKRVES